jgi:hypothetical protein
MYLHDTLKSNKTIILEAIQRNALIYEWIGSDLQKDKEICLATLRKDGYSLKLMPQIFRDDKEIVKVAIASKGGALLYASVRLKKDKELIRLATKKSGYYQNRLKNPIHRSIHPVAWESYIYEDTLEILYGKDASFIQSSKLIVNGSIHIQTDLPLKSIAILQNTKGQQNLIAWYVVNNQKAIKFHTDIKYAQEYIIIAEGIHGELYMTTHNIEQEYYGCGQAYLREEKKYQKFFNTHLKRKVTYDGTNTHLDFMIVNETSSQYFITKVRVEMGNKTVFTIHTSPYLSKNPYFNILLPHTKKEKVTIFCTDSKHPKEYIWEDKIALIKEKKNYPMNLWK